MKQLFKVLFSALFFEKIAAFGLLICIGWILSDFLILFFVTFLLVSIFSTIGDSVVGWIRGGEKKYPKSGFLRWFHRYNKTTIIVSILYIIFVGAVIFIIANIIPQLIIEMKAMSNHASQILGRGQGLLGDLGRLFGMDLDPSDLMNEIVNQSNIESIGKTLIASLQNTGLLFTKFLLALLLSYMFIIEKSSIGLFLSRIKDGNFSFFYREWAIIGEKVNNSFGLIFRAQAFIALINALLTSVGLLIVTIAFQHGPFPFLLTLSMVVFIFGFIPVFGTFLSGIPILIIGYSFGGWPVVLACISMILFVHAFESYYMNPRIVSSYIKFPVFITFITLLISEHIFGLIGLLIGVPLLSILLSFIEDFDRYLSIIQKKCLDSSQNL